MKPWNVEFQILIYLKVENLPSTPFQLDQLGFLSSDRSMQTCQRFSPYQFSLTVFFLEQCPFWLKTLRSPLCVFETTVGQRTEVEVVRRRLPASSSSMRLMPSAVNVGLAWAVATMRGSRPWISCLARKKSPTQLTQLKDQEDCKRPICWAECFWSIYIWYLAMVTIFDSEMKQLVPGVGTGIFG